MGPMVRNRGTQERKQWSDNGMQVTEYRPQLLLPVRPMLDDRVAR